jgi:ribonuclease P protein component
LFAGEPAIHAFQQSKRLRKTDDISSVFSFKCQAYGEFLRVLVKPNQLDHARLAVIVGKKTVAHATSRNYIKRALREMFRLHQDRFGGWDIVILVRKGFSSDSFGRVQLDFMQLIGDLQKKLA